MVLKQVLEQASKLATPSQAEQAKVKQAASTVVDKVNSYLKKSKVDAELIPGGSFAKGTWLPGATDIDCFLLFDYKKYKDKSSKLADLAEKILKKCFSRIKRLHGSRDYFQIKQSNYIFEIIPVLRIEDPEEALNITDVSPLHVIWVRKNVAKKPELLKEIRLSKQFAKGRGVYGAESYIRGFSGHVLELLTTHFGGFVELLNHISKISGAIDPASHYKNKDPFKAINRSKLGPLLVIDPIQPERNAAAALNKNMLKRLQMAAKEFLKKPSIESFKRKWLIVADLKKKPGKIIVLHAKPIGTKIDIAGAKLLKQFEYLSKQLKRNDFKILEQDWQWESKINKPAMFWFCIDPKPLSTAYKHYGPPIHTETERIEGFKKKYGKKVKREKGVYYVELKREYRQPLPLINTLLKKKEFKNIKI